MLHIKQLDETIVETHSNHIYVKKSLHGRFPE